MNKLDHIEVAKKFYIDEMNDNLIYSLFTNYVKNTDLKKFLIKICRTELWHAKFWAGYIQRHWWVVPIIDRLRNKRFYKILYTIFPPLMILRIKESFERDAIKKYYEFIRNNEFDDKYKIWLKNVILDELEHENYFKDFSKGIDNLNIRDFVLWINDWLVELLWTVSWLTAVYMHDTLIVWFSGLIIWVAWALSMWFGAYISVRSQRQVSQSLKEERDIIFEIAPKEAQNQYKKILIESWLSIDIADKISQDIWLEKEILSKLLIPQVTENEMKSWLITWFAYIIWVLCPIIPFFIASTSIWALIISIILWWVLLAITGFMIALFSWINLKTKIIEMLTIWSIAIILSYMFGLILDKFVIW